MRNKPAILILLIAISPLISVQSKAEANDISSLLGQGSSAIASGYRQERSKAPAVVTVITKSEISRNGHTTLGDLLRTIPGLNVSIASDATATVATSRGQINRLLLMFDGVEVATGSITSFGHLNRIPLFDVEYVEIMRGPNSAVYGADAVLGVVNIVTSTQKGQTSKVGVIAGSDNEVGIYGTYIDTIANRRFGLSVSKSTTDGNRPFIERDRQSSFDALFGTQASNSPGRAVSSAVVSNLQLSYEISENFSLSSHYYKAELGSGVGFSQALDPEGGIDFTATIDQLGYKNTLSEWDIGAVLTRYTSKGAGFGSYFPEGAFGGLFPDGVDQLLTPKETRYKFEVTGYKEFENHKVRLGLDYRDSKVTTVTDARNFVLSPASPIPVPLGQTIEFANTDETFFNDLDSTLKSLYFSDEWSITNDLSVTGGFRYDDHSTAGSNVSPRVALVWNKSLDSTYKLLYGEAFRPPSATELSSSGLLFIALGNRDLEAVTLSTVEFIAENRPTNRISSIFSAYFYELDDFVISVDDPTSPNGQKFINYDSTIKGKGIEWELSWNITDNISIKPSWSYAKNRDDSVVRESTVTVPEQTFKLQATAELRNEWSASLIGQKIIGRQRNAIDTRDDVPDYETVDIVLHKSGVFGNTDVNLRIRNIFNEDARDPLGFAIFNDYPIYQRTLQLTAERQF